MELIVGLGNPGATYQGTPHNLGFDVVEILARRWGFSWRRAPSWRSETAQGTARGTGAPCGRPIRLLKPLTYMNLSGEAVGAFASYYQIEPREILVISDEIQLPLGRMRLRAEGSDGGHKGLRSVVQHLGTRDFPRLRIGCAPPSGRFVQDRVNFVLGRWSGSEREWVRRIVEAAADAVEAILRDGFDRAMTDFNRLSIPSPDAPPDSAPNPPSNPPPDCPPGAAQSSPPA